MSIQTKQKTIWTCSRPPESVQSFSIAIAMEQEQRRREIFKKNNGQDVPHVTKAMRVIISKGSSFKLCFMSSVMQGFWFNQLVGFLYLYICNRTVRYKGKITPPVCHIDCYPEDWLVLKEYPIETEVDYPLVTISMCLAAPGLRGPPNSFLPALQQATVPSGSASGRFIQFPILK